jgi:hypothetical protein
VPTWTPSLPTIFICSLISDNAAPPGVHMPGTG